MLCQIYIFALLGMELILADGDYGKEYEVAAHEHFGNLFHAMLAMLQLMTLDSISAVYQPLVRARPWLASYFVFCILVQSISFMNLVTGICVESSLRTAKEDEDAQRAWESLRRKKMRPKLMELFDMLDTNRSGELELHELVNAPESLQDQLNRICNMDDIQETFRILDHDDSGTVDLDEFCNTIMRVSHSEKPAELIRLVRQNQEIVGNLKEIKAQLDEAMMSRC
jgi:hypothetical protein